jgi:hypothetical protein
MWGWLFMATHHCAPAGLISLQPKLLLICCIFPYATASTLESGSTHHVQLCKIWLKCTCAHQCSARPQHVSIHSQHFLQKGICNSLPHEGLSTLTWQLSTITGPTEYPAQSITKSMTAAGPTQELPLRTDQYCGKSFQARLSQQQGHCPCFLLTIVAAVYPIYSQW